MCASLAKHLRDSWAIEAECSDVTMNHRTLKVRYLLFVFALLLLGNEVGWAALVRVALAVVMVALIICGAATPFAKWFAKANDEINKTAEGT